MMLMVLGTRRDKVPKNGWRSEPGRKHPSERLPCTSHQASLLSQWHLSIVKDGKINQVSILSFTLLYFYFILPP